MKHFLFTITMALIGFGATAQAQNNKCHIYGNVEGIGDSVLVKFISLSGQSAPAPQKFKAEGNGKFDINIALDKASIVYICDAKRMKERQMSAGFSFYAIPGEEANVTGNMEKQTYTGTTFYKQLNAGHEAMAKYNDKIKALTKEYSKATNAAPKEKRDSVRESFNPKFDKVRHELGEGILNYLKSHSDEDASLLLLMGVDESQIEEGEKLLTQSVLTGKASAVYNDYKPMAKHQAELKKNANAIVDNADAPDFTLQDINGKPFTLSSLRGQYVILDFWGSWCGWCIKDMPKMKEYYNKYKGKFQIVGVDCNDSPEKWKAAVEKEQLPWLHVYNKTGVDPDVSALYGIQAYPTKIVVSPEGKIVKVAVGEGEDFYNLLDTLFNKKD